MRAVLFLTVALAGCSPEKTARDTVDAATAAIGDNVDAAVADGRLKPSAPYYPQPDFKSERFFKVEDQVGCKWWISNGHKFDHNYIVLKADGKPDCPATSDAPAPEVDYVDAKGQRW